MLPISNCGFQRTVGIVLILHCTPIHASFDSHDVSIHICFVWYIFDSTTATSAALVVFWFAALVLRKDWLSAVSCFKCQGAALSACKVVPTYYSVAYVLV